MRLAEALFTCAAFLWLACGDRESPAKLSPAVTPIPEAALSPFPEHAINLEDLSPKTADELVRGPMQVRFSTPGRVRWYVDFQAPVTEIRRSPLKGFSITAGKEVLNVTSRGELRWRQVAGFGHRLFTIGDVEAVWSPAFSTISEIGFRGMSGWTRDWTGGVIGDDRGVFLFDASTVSALGPDGQDKWRIALEGIRKVEGPFACKGSVMFHGMSGLKGQTVQISERGTVLRVTELNRGAQLLGASALCDPLIWHEGELRLISDRGVSRWSRSYPNLPLVSRLDNGFLVTASRAGLPAAFEIISDDGRTVSSGKLPVTGRLCRADAILSMGLDVQVMGFCLDVTHPCAKPGSDRGPYNAVVTADGKGGFRTLIRHTAGHLGAVRLDDGGFLIAGSKEENATDVEMRSRYHEMVWQLALPGRISAGPYIGLYGDAYVATCTGWTCNQPYRLFSMTMKKEQEAETPMDSEGSTAFDPEEETEHPRSGPHSTSNIPR